MEKSYQPPFVSVIMPAYNSEEYIREAIESVQAQTFLHWEMIIVDDCSTDRTRFIIKEFESKDQRIKLIENEKNGGTANARNKGIALATGKLIALLDSDDIWKEDKIAKQVHSLQQTGAQISYCSYDFINEHGVTTGRPYIVPPEASFYSMLEENVMSSSTVLIEASLLKENLFNLDYYNEDYLLWMILLKKGASVVGVTDVLSHYRRAGESKSSKKAKVARHRWKIYRDGLGLPFFTSCKAFISYARNGMKKYYV